MLKSVRFFAVMLALTASVAVGGVVSAQDSGSLAAPTGVNASNGSVPGEVIVTWDAVSGAQFYRIGWVAYPDYQEITLAGGDWLETFAFVDVANRGQTSHAVGRLSPGVLYAFIVASNDSRYGEPQWSDWATLNLNEGTTGIPPDGPTTPAGILTVAPTTNVSCAVGMVLSPGMVCNWVLPPGLLIDGSRIAGVVYIINGGELHGRLELFRNDGGDISLNVSQTGPIVHIDGASCWSVWKKVGNVWTVESLNQTTPSQSDPFRTCG